MADVKIAPLSCGGNNLWNPITNRKKYTICCGRCRHIWSDKVSLGVDAATSTCPNCGGCNVWSHADFKLSYSNALSNKAAQP